MPFKSKTQAKYLFANNPKVAKEFASKTPSIKKLPNKVKSKKKQGVNMFGFLKIKKECIFCKAPATEIEDVIIYDATCETCKRRVDNILIRYADATQTLQPFERFKLDIRVKEETNRQLNEKYFNEMRENVQLKKEIDAMKSDRQEIISAHIAEFERKLIVIYNERNSELECKTALHESAVTSLVETIKENERLTRENNELIERSNSFLKQVEEADKQLNHRAENVSNNWRTIKNLERKLRMEICTNSKLQQENERLNDYIEALVEAKALKQSQKSNARDHIAITVTHKGNQFGTAIAIENDTYNEDYLIAASRELLSNVDVKSTDKIAEVPADSAPSFKVPTFGDYCPEVRGFE